MPLDGLVVLVKFTTSGAHPDVGVAVKPAVNANELALKHRLSNKLRIRRYNFIGIVRNMTQNDTHYSVRIVKRRKIL